MLLRGAGALLPRRQEEARRGIDQAGNDDLAGDVDDLGLGRNGDVLADVDDLAVGDDDGRVLDRGCGTGIDLGAAKGDDLGLGLS